VLRSLPGPTPKLAQQLQAAKCTHRPFVGLKTKHFSGMLGVVWSLGLTPQDL
jgi:hypothetical protein